MKKNCQNTNSLNDIQQDVNNPLDKRQHNNNPQDKQKHINRQLAFGVIICFIIFGAYQGYRHMNIYPHLIKDSKVREVVLKDFEARKVALLHNRQVDLLDVLPSCTPEESEGIKFLYAYSTLSDLCNYNWVFFREQVRLAVMARDSFPWGRSVSEQDFLHFVLPPRAGSENMDMAREVIFVELLPRLRGMSMKDAALEVNHWCHEHVVYQSADDRTSAPLATIKSAYGRCGEESVLTVTALRAVGIPARQIYTPRWAHQDDNHAWVEFWADGKWYYYGACEPEPDVNMGWFTEPARRTMLTATTTPGDYPSALVINRERYYTRLNQIDNYAEAKDLVVRVTNIEGKPMIGVTVRYLLYNYAEFYPLATLKTNSQGLSHLRLGLGDVMVWAGDDDRFAFRKVSVAQADTVSLVLLKRPFDEYTDDVDFIPPVAKAPFAVSQGARELNNKRLAYEDSLRGAYEATFMNLERAARFIDSSNARNADKSTKADLAKFLVQSRGNHSELCRLINEPDLATWAADILRVLSEKDLRDCPADVLLSHIRHTAEPFVKNSPNSSNNTTSSLEYQHIWAQYLLNPRIGIEMLTPYKEQLFPLFSADFWKDVLRDPRVAESWVNDSIKLVDDQENYIKVPSVPLGTLQMRAGDAVSRNILFVAICRTAGVPARIDQVTGRPQYYVAGDAGGNGVAGGKWINVFEPSGAPTLKPSDYAQIQLVFKGTGPCKYYNNFTLARYADGFFRTLEYDFGKDINLFPASLQLEPGYYMLVTGNRLGDGSVLSKVTFFYLTQGAKRKIPVEIRNPEVSTKPLANIKLPDFITRLDGSKVETGQLIRTYGAVAMIWLDPAKEPSRHVLNDLAGMKAAFDASLLPFVFFVQQDKADKFRPASYVLPTNSIFAPDPTVKSAVASGKTGSSSVCAVDNVTNNSNSEILSQLTSKLNAQKTCTPKGTGTLSGNTDQYPVVILVNAHGDVLYFSSGYKIGVCDQLLKTFSLVGIKK